MGDWETPGTGVAEPLPETCQQHHPPPQHDDDQQHQPDEAQELLRQQRQLKRSSLPARPHAAARHSKRLTLNFPINLPPGVIADSSVSPSPGAMTPVSRSSARQSPVPPIGTQLAFDDQDDGSQLLTAIAGQERKVLELREELQRAESHLDSLKKQWALSEKTKKRTEISHRAEPLLPLRSPDSAGPDSVDGQPQLQPQHTRDRSIASSDSSSVAASTQPRYSRELDRRQSMRAAASKGTKISANGRRVFQGSHTRTLSLLSPVTGSSGSPLGSTSEMGLPDPERIGRSPRSATLPSSTERRPIMTVEDLQNPSEDVMAQWRTMPQPSREALMRTGRQMASDLREGLWTFLEDIRQATVGEEGINATESRTVPRNRDSSSTSRSRDRLSVVAQEGKLSRSPSAGSKGTKTSGKDSQSADINSSFWSEFGIDAPGQKSPPPDRANNNTHPDGPNDPDGPSNNNARNSSSNNSNNPDNLDVDDNWDEWDTPQPKKMHTPSSSRSTLESKNDQSPMTQASSPRTSTSFGDWRHSQDAQVPDPSVSDGIPWPAITKLTPSKLTRTASNLMAEWERSLSPSPERKEVEKKE